MREREGDEMEAYLKAGDGASRDFCPDDIAAGLVKREAERDHNDMTNDISEALLAAWMAGGQQVVNTLHAPVLRVLGAFLTAFDDDNEHAMFAAATEARVILGRMP